MKLAYYECTVGSVNAAWIEARCDADMAAAHSAALRPKHVLNRTFLTVMVLLGRRQKTAKRYEHTSVLSSNIPARARRHHGAALDGVH
jgi:hypothetical protein